MRYFLLTLFTFIFITGTSQDSTVAQPLSLKQFSRYLTAVGNKYSKLDKQLLHSGNKALQKLRKQERKIYRKLYRKDSVAAKQFLAASDAYYMEQMQVMHDTSNVKRKQLKEYLPQFDSVNTSIAYLQQQIQSKGGDLTQSAAAKKATEQFAQRIQLGNTLKKQLKERKQQLAEQLSQHGMVKEMKRLNKTMYYYQQQLKEYKALVNDPKKIEKKAIAALRESKFFIDFMKKNSMLSQLFRIPDNYGSAESLAGLQTRAGVQAMLNTRFAGAGVNPREYMQGQFNEAQAHLNTVKAKLNKLRSSGVGNSSSDIDMPEKFKPNSQKTKSFLKRLEYGANFQTQRSNGLFPVTTDVALTLGYKLNDKTVIGVGAAYKMGWGNSIENIKLTHEGIGLRSYADLKLKGSLWITGGYEQNYFQRFTDLRVLNNLNVWRQSALAGMTKKIKMGKKKESKVQLLYDFLYKQNNISTQPLIFRVGYSF